MNSKFVNILRKQCRGTAYVFYHFSRFLLAKKAPTPQKGGRGLIVYPAAFAFYAIACKTAFFSGMLGIPPECSVERLAAAAAKVPI